MIVILQPNITHTSDEYKTVRDYLEHLPDVTIREHQEHGKQQVLTEFYLIGSTANLPKQEIESLPGVERVVRISEEYRIIGRHRDDHRPTSFEYNGVTFSQDNLNIFAGLCAVDTPEHVEQMMRLYFLARAWARLGVWQDQLEGFVHP